MRITEAARALGVSASWLRDMERRGRIARAPKDVNGQRRYDADAIEVIRRLLMTQRGYAPQTEAPK